MSPVSMEQLVSHDPICQGVYCYRLINTRKATYREDRGAKRRSYRYVFFNSEWMCLTSEIDLKRIINSNRENVDLYVEPHQA